MSKRTKDDLKQLQSMPLDAKILMTQTRIREWVREFGESGVYVSFSGGKDSTVLLDIVRKMFPDIEAVFVDTGLEYPEIRQFVKTFDNVTILHPDMRFDEVIKKYGYPMISKEISKCVSEIKNAVSEKRYCLSAMKFGVSKDEYGGLNDSGKYDYAKTCSNSMFMHLKYRPLVDVNFKMSANCCNVMKKLPAKNYEKKTDKRL